MPRFWREGFESRCSRCGWDIEDDQQICAHHKHHSDCCHNAVNWVIIK